MTPRPVMLPAALALLLVAPLVLAQAPASTDTTWVRTFDEEFINWATPHTQSFEFPDGADSYGDVLLYVTIGCPGYPGDCDPWDRYAWLRLVEDLGGGDTRDVEIARFITPYDITPTPPYPGSCQWVYDLSDYRFLLRDQVTLKLYIESWMGDDRGWLITCDFAFVSGYSELRPFHVENLYLDDFIVYGDDYLAHEAELPPVPVAVPAEAAAAKVRFSTTGHGFGFFQNCAEFCPKYHSVVVQDETWSHQLWNICNTNPCSPQGGTWQYNRSGWCPGDKVTPWDNDISHLLVPGGEMVFDYNIQEYFNPCNPTNPDCVPGETCDDCNYDGTTPPNWKVMGQVIFYRHDVTAAPGGTGTPRLELGQNYPNPFNPTTTIFYEIHEPGTALLRIISAGGRVLHELQRRHDEPGRFHYLWDGRDARGGRAPSGVYFYELQIGEERQARKMILLQ